MPPADPVARLNFRLTPDLKRVIEEAALQTGRTVSDFALATLAQAARQVLAEHHATRLSARDRARIMAMLDDSTTKPNRALVEAARRYKKQVG